MDGVEKFISQTNVSRETLNRLQIYHEQMLRWQKTINLVSPATLPDVWTRHFLDSAQLAKFLPTSGRLVDMGSGAGFPGLVVAIMCPQLDVHLIESDQRKAVFLREVSRVTNTRITIHNARVGELPNLQADVITARALAPLDELLDMALFHVKQSAEMLFLKGQDVVIELAIAQQSYDFQHQLYPSRTAASGAIVHLAHVKRR